MSRRTMVTEASRGGRQVVDDISMLTIGASCLKHGHRLSWGNTYAADERVTRNPNLRCDVPCTPLDYGSGSIGLWLHNARLTSSYLGTAWRFSLTGVSGTGVPRIRPHSSVARTRSCGSRSCRRIAGATDRTTKSPRWRAGMWSGSGSARYEGMLLAPLVGYWRRHEAAVVRTGSASYDRRSCRRTAVGAGSRRTRC